MKMREALSWLSDNRIGLATEGIKSVGIVVFFLTQFNVFVHLWIPIPRDESSLYKYTSFSCRTVRSSPPPFFLARVVFV